MAAYDVSFRMGDGLCPGSLPTPTTKRNSADSVQGASLRARRQRASPATFRRFADAILAFQRCPLHYILLMPPAKNAKSAGLRVGIIRAISTPLGFYVLSLLIVEATIGLVLTASKLSEDHVW